MPHSTGPSLDGSKLHAPLARLLRPLVRLLIRSGITFPALIDLLRELYVNVAENEFPLPDKAQTDSRVSLLTGIHRKEVRRLRGAGAPVNMVPAAVSAPRRSSRGGRPRLNSRIWRDARCHCPALPKAALPLSSGLWRMSPAMSDRGPCSTNGSTADL